VLEVSIGRAAAFAEGDIQAAAVQRVAEILRPGFDPAGDVAQT
jgi:hypothetical protein